MSAVQDLSSPRNPKWASLLVLGGAILVAAVTIRPYAASWNDGSRLAVVECVVDHGTLAIDDSIFVDVPQTDDPKAPRPYTTVHPKLEHLNGPFPKGYVSEDGDKIFIRDPQLGLTGGYRKSGPETWQQWSVTGLFLSETEVEWINASIIGIGGRSERTRIRTWQGSLPYWQVSGTGDKIFVRAADGRLLTGLEPAGESTWKEWSVRGRFYSDKTYVPSLILTVPYRLLQWSTGLKASERPDLFCYFMTLFSSGVAYVLAVWWTFRIATVLHVPLFWRMLLAASFALATVAWPYAEQVNSHVLVLACTCGIMLQMVNVAREHAQGSASSWRRFAVLGVLGGLCYAFEQAIGQLLWGWTMVWVAYRCRRSRLLLNVGTYLAFSLPFLAWHHVVNYQIGGTLKPANAAPEHFDYPGSPFDESNTTGHWNHTSVGHFIGYAIGLWISQRGFLLYNLPLMLALGGVAWLLKRKAIPTAELLFIMALTVSTWATYAIFSRNYSGYCISVRWFLPLLAPGYYLLALIVREIPRFRIDFLILSGCGAILGGMMAWTNPWEVRVEAYWIPVSAGLVYWAGYVIYDRERFFAASRQGEG